MRASSWISNFVFVPLPTLSIISRARDGPWILTTWRTCQRDCCKVYKQGFASTSLLLNSLQPSIPRHPLTTMAVLSTLLHATAFKTPFLSTLLPSIGLAYTLQAAVAIPSILAQSEKFYDLSGSLTYLSCTALGLYLPTIRARYAAAAMGAVKPAWPSVIGALRGLPNAGLNWRQIVLSAAVALWATRRMFCSHTDGLL